MVFLLLIWPQHAKIDFRSHLPSEGIFHSFCHFSIIFLCDISRGSSLLSTSIIAGLWPLLFFLLHAIVRSLHSLVVAFSESSPSPKSVQYYSAAWPVHSTHFTRAARLCWGLRLWRERGPSLRMTGWTWGRCGYAEGWWALGDARTTAIMVPWGLLNQEGRVWNWTW